MEVIPFPMAIGFEFPILGIFEDVPCGPDFRLSNQQMRLGDLSAIQVPLGNFEILSQAMAY